MLLLDTWVFLRCLARVGFGLWGFRGSGLGVEDLKLESIRVIVKLAGRHANDQGRLADSDVTPSL